MSPDFAAKPTLVGTLVTLVPATAAHVAELYPLLADPEVGRLTGSVHTSGDADPLPWTQSQISDIYEQWSAATDRIVWVIIDKASGQLVGESVLNDLDVDNLCCGFRIWIAGATNRGLGTEAVRLTIEHALKTQGLHRVELEVYAFNPRAKRVYEKVGFRTEGIKRDALRYDDGWVDAYQMAILETD